MSIQEYKANKAKEKGYEYNEIGTMNQRTFNLIVGLLVGYGFMINTFISYFFGATIIRKFGLLAILFYFVSTFAGIAIMRISKNPIISFIGFNMIVLPISICVSVVVLGYKLDTILMAMFITGVVTIIMTIAAVIKPNIFLKMGTALFFSLIAVIICEIILLFLGRNLAILDWVVAIIFSLYIGYDWARINNVVYKTFDSAIDCAADIYLDIINLFLRVIRILNRNSD